MVAIFINNEGLVDHVQFTVTVTEQIEDISISGSVSADFSKYRMSVC